MIRASIIGTVIVALLTASVALSRSPRASQSLDARENALIDRWLVCYECVSGQLDSVVDLGSRKPTETRNRLVLDVLQGPDSGRRRNIATQLDRSYARLARAGRPRVSQRAYVAHYLSNYVAAHRIRATVALAIVGASDSTTYRALDSAVADTGARSDVRDAARFARDSIWRP